MLEITNTIPPPVRNERITMSTVLDRMDVNDSVEVLDTISRRSYVYKLAKDKDIKVTVKAMPHGQMRIWRTA